MLCILYNKKYKGQGDVNTAFKVKKIEFEFTKEVHSIGNKFYECLKKYASNAVSKVEIYCEGNKLIFELKAPISLNTVNNAVSALLKKTQIKIHEIEYKLKDKKVEVEIE